MIFPRTPKLLLAPAPEPNQSLPEDASGLLDDDDPVSHLDDIPDFDIDAEETRAAPSLVFEPETPSEHGNQTRAEFSIEMPLIGEDSARLLSTPH